MQHDSSRQAKAEYSNEIEHIWKFLSKNVNDYTKAYTE